MPDIYMYLPLVIVLAIFAAFFIGRHQGLRERLSPTERRRLENIATSSTFYGDTVQADPEAGMWHGKGGRRGS